MISCECYKQSDIMIMFDIKSPSTLWRWVKQGKFPQADINPNSRDKRWYKSTIQKYKKGVA